MPWLHVQRNPRLNCVKHQKTHDPQALASFELVLYPLLISAYSLNFLFCFHFASQGHDDAVPCAVLKSVDSFSFLHHPVHQRSLEILQRCKEEKYSKAPPPALPSDMTLTQEMETRCIQSRKSEKNHPRSLQASNYNNFEPIGKLLGRVWRVKLNPNPHLLR